MVVCLNPKDLREARVEVWFSEKSVNLLTVGVCVDGGWEDCTFYTCVFLQVPEGTISFQEILGGGQEIEELSMFP